MNFDPMTGEPIKKEEPKVEMNFDPMTGEPIKKEEPKVEMNFDPMTGKPLKGGAIPPIPATPVNAGGFAKKKSSKKWLLALPILAVVVLGVAAFASGIFTGKATKVALAVANTLGEETKLSKKITANDIILSGNYTVSADMDVEDVSVDVSLRVKDSEKQISGSANVSGIAVSFLGALTNKEVKLQVPMLGDKVFLYNYTGKNNGYLVEELGDENIEAINSVLKAVSSEKSQTELAKKLTAVIKKEYKTLEFESAGKEKFEIDDKDRSCKGYTTTFTSDNWENIVEGMEDVVEEEYEDALDLAGQELNASFDELKRAMPEDIELEVTFYIYKNKLACIRMEEGSSDMELRFLGGDYRAQNMELEVDGQNYMEIKGSSDKKEETIEAFFMGMPVMKFSYDYDDGDFECYCYDDYEQLQIDGNIQSSGKEMTMELERITMGGMSVNVDGTVTVKKGTDMERFDGEEFDIGNASESDFMALAQALYALGIY